MIVNVSNKTEICETVTLEVENRSETMRNRKNAKFCIYTVIQNICIAHLTKKLSHFEKRYTQKSEISLVNPLVISVFLLTFATFHYHSKKTILYYTFQMLI